MTRFYHAKHLPDGSQNPKWTYRKRPSGPPIKGKFERGEFIAWDGEGATDANGRHIYTMLLNSEGQSLVNGFGLSTEDCLSLLVQEGNRKRHAVHVIFGGSYDVNMMLADCTEAELTAVWSGEWTNICDGRFAVCYRPRKSFSVRLASFDIANGKVKRRRAHAIVLWDVIGFFQCTFVDALKKYLPKYEHTAYIAEHKARRRDFRIEDAADMLAYSQKECEALVMLMQTLRQYLREAGLKISRWDGAGACAAALLKREGVLSHKGMPPEEVQRASQYAYAGGRTELIQFGHAPHTPIYHYDINSAYPDAMRRCPSLAGGRWQRISSKRAILDAIENEAFALVHCEWDFTNDCDAFPFFWRAYDTSIYYPARGSGWFWTPEVAAAMAAHRAGVVQGRITLSKCWRFDSCDAVYPFTWIDTLFAQRREWKRTGAGAEKAIKLAINSLYGKTAQHLGGSKNKPPRYHQLEWAGFITSATRAKLYRALIPALKEHAAIMSATDAVYSLIPLDLPTGSELGQWSNEPHDGITVVQSGVYWTYNDSKPKAFSRGFDKGSLKLDEIVQAWREGKSEYDASLTRFCTMGSALHRTNGYADDWRQWRTSPRILALSPAGTKRALASDGNPADGLQLTQPAIPAAQIVGQRHSAPYPLPWSEGAEWRDQWFDGAPLREVEAEHWESEA